MKVDAGDRATVLVHYYRAMVARADIWRTRMDTTTNWALGATAAVVSFSVGNPGSPHYVVFIASLLTGIFLYFEARRLTFYHLWQQRASLVERDFIRSALDPDAGPIPGTEPLETALLPHLGRTVPTMTMGKAMARRLRRIYLFLFLAQLVAWAIKLSEHPTPVNSMAEIATRAQIGIVPGAVMLSLVAVSFLGLVAYSIHYGGVDRRPTALDPVTD